MEQYLAAKQALMASKSKSRTMIWFGVAIAVVVATVVIVLVITRSEDQQQQQEQQQQQSQQKEQQEQQQTQQTQQQEQQQQTQQGQQGQQQTPPATGKNVRYMRLNASQLPEALNIAEIQALDAAGNKITGGIPSLSPQYLDAQTFGPLMFNDGDLSTFGHTTNVVDAQMQLDLGSEKVVHKVRIENRRDCCKERILDAVVTISNAANQTVCDLLITEVKDTYDIDLTKVEGTSCA